MKYLLRKILLFFSFTVLIIISSICILFILYFFKGKNYSDTGIPMFINSNNLYFIGITVYFLLSTLLLLMYQIKIEKKGNSIIIIGIPFLILYFLFFQWILAWTINSGIYIKIF
jgi:hypothetical protein